ncbi:hypothetical protein C7U92_12355 [Bradyrhizobium sp. WBOS7]|uniref:Uncharacterized protein n=1 Tax=Bradyrhizobium betae TaxID=244734 RepID=A0AAE9N9L3_9BRAD|nr:MULTISPECIES: hypothetical protein [Bradyrhizobium]MDD1527908.1 hypothetical protein [Bradyrhizobium sp. WBOS2]MDD1570880.1 hypothetical protein [Bradyrhizobium sp. WBOS1]MDD1577520.1 hypothetical protein [Bradyrhizobium sp. WBOS7]UUO35142.1 hypothetical protein DCK84_11590 [Bradyrhizobium sp. WBOS01]MDD1600465.1 hypothetical protein [Bradyrhizobium sp. WBOS16]
MSRTFAWPVHRGLAAILLCLSFPSTGYGEDGWQWRVNKISDGRLLLAFTETEATDELGSVWFYCQPASGSIEVFKAANDSERKVLADFIRSNTYPKVQLEGEASIVEPLFSEAGGWEYRFRVKADGAWFNKFKQTGRIGYKLGSGVADYGKDPIARSGLKKVAEFQAQCLRSGTSEETKAQR